MPPNRTPPNPSEAPAANPHENTVQASSGIPTEPKVGGSNPSGCAETRAAPRSGRLFSFSPGRWSSPPPRELARAEAGFDGFPRRLERSSRAGRTEGPSIRDHADSHVFESGGSLALVTSEAENEAAYSACTDGGTTYPQCWIGLAQSTDDLSWTWVNGVSLEWSNWDEGEGTSGDENFAFYTPDNGATWHDVNENGDGETIALCSRCC